MKSLREYVEARSIPIPFVGCWLWLLSVGSHGYGQGITTSKRVTVAHRLSFEAFVGPIPADMLVQHSCDNRWCVNPDHLSLGTDKTNSDDKHRKNRAGLDKRKYHRLTDEQAEEILWSDETNVALAKRFGVDPKTVLNIKYGRSHGHLSGPHRLLKPTADVIEEADRLLAAVMLEPNFDEWTEVSP